MAEKLVLSKEEYLNIVDKAISLIEAGHAEYSCNAIAHAFLELNLHLYHEVNFNILSFNVDLIEQNGAYVKEIREQLFKDTDFDIYKELVDNKKDELTSDCSSQWLFNKFDEFSYLFTKEEIIGEVFGAEGFNSFDFEYSLDELKIIRVELLNELKELFKSEL